MRSRRDESIIGQRYGRLVVLSFSHTSADHRQSFWHCACDCGVQCVRNRNAFVTGNTKSCGCWGTEFRQKGLSRYRHGGAHSPEYRIWCMMKRRCLSPSARYYKDYGGRGIRVCDSWANDFAAFISDMGPRPSAKHSLDRIDNDKGYEPGNCRWATWRQQASNRRANMWLTVGAERLIVTEWSRRVGLAPSTISNRKRAGWSDEEAVLTPAWQRKIAA